MTGPTEGHAHREAAKAIVGLGESVLPEFEAAWLNHVADSPEEFAASVAGMESVADLGALAE